MKPFIEFDNGRSHKAFRKERIFLLTVEKDVIHVFTYDKERVDIYFDNTHAASVAYKNAMKELNNVQ